MWTMSSIRNWEQLTIECGWSISQYVGRMQKLLKRALVRGHEPHGAILDILWRIALVAVAEQLCLTSVFAVGGEDS